MTTSPSSPNSKITGESQSHILRTAGYFLIVLAGLATLIALFVVEEDLRGKFAWDSALRQAVARGDDLDWQKFIPAPVADEENFAMTPFLAPLFDFNPTPLQPGQSRWRDTNATDLARNFALNVNSTVVAEKRPESVIAAGHIMDFTAVAKRLKIDADSTSAAQATLNYLEQFQPVMDEIEKASHRPASRFNVSYNDEYPGDILLPHLAVLKRMTILLNLQASANLSLGRPDTAFKETQLMLYLTDAISSETFLITHLVRVAMLHFSQNVIWEGLAEGQWTDAQLSAFQASLQKVNLPGDVRRSLNAERAAHISVSLPHLHKHPEVLDEYASENGGKFGHMFKISPSGWMYMDQANYLRNFDEKVTVGIDEKTWLFRPREVDKAVAGFRPIKGHVWQHVLRHDVFSSLMIPSMDRFYGQMAVGQTGVNEAIIACAIERYRLANHTLPGALDALVPKYLEQVPLDVCNGQPLIYKAVSDRDFILYSVGWNQTDDGGVGAADDRQKGDWTWPMYSGK